MHLFCPFKFYKEEIALEVLCVVISNNQLVVKKDVESD